MIFVFNTTKDRIHTKTQKEYIHLQESIHLNIKVKLIFEIHLKVKWNLYTSFWQNKSEVRKNNFNKNELEIR